MELATQLHDLEEFPAKTKGTIFYTQKQQKVKVHFLCATNSLIWKVFISWTVEMNTSSQ